MNQTKRILSIFSIFLVVESLFNFFFLRSVFAAPHGEVELLVPEGEQLDGLQELRSLRLGRVRLLAFSHDGAQLATAAEEGTICLWNVATGRPSRCIPKGSTANSSGGVTALAFSQGNRWIAAGYSDGHVDVEPIKPERIGGAEAPAPCSFGALPQSLNPGRAISSVAFAHSDGSLLSIGSRNGTVRSCPRAFEMADGRSDKSEAQPPQALPGLAGPPSSLFDRAVLDQEGHVVAVAMGRSLGVWDLSTGTQRWLQTGTSLVTAIAMSPNGKRLAVGLLNGAVSLWQVDSGKEQPLASRPRAVRTLAFAPNGEQLAGGSDDNHLSVWDVGSGLVRTELARRAPIAAVAFRPDGLWLAAASEDAGISLWETGSWQELPSLRMNADPIQSIAFNADGTRLATGSDDQRVRIWKKKQGGAAGPEWIEECSAAVQTGKIRSLAFSLREKGLVAVATESRSVQLVNADEGCRPRAQIEDKTDWVRSVAFSSDGNQLATGSADGSVRIWNTTSWTEVRSFPPQREEVRALAFSPGNGNLLAAGYMDGTVCLWRADGNADKDCHTLAKGAGGVRSVAFSPDGMLLAMTVAKEVALWDVANRRLRENRLALGGAAAAVRFSTDGKRLFAGGEEGAIYRWEVESQQPLGELLLVESPEARAPIHALDISRDGKTVAAASAGQLRLWGGEAGALQAHLWQGIHGWASWAPGQRLYRREDGGLLWHQNTHGDIEPLLPPFPPADRQANLRLDSWFTKTSGGGALVGTLHTKVSNAVGSARAYWLRIEASELPGHHDLRDKLSLQPPPIHMRLEPGQSIVLPIDLYLKQPGILPPRPLGLCPSLLHAHGAVASQCADEPARFVSLRLGPWCWQHVNLLLLGTAGLLAAATGGIWWRRRRRALGHPTIRGLRSGRLSLSALSLREIPEAERALRRAESFRAGRGLRESALRKAGLDPHGWERAQAAVTSPAACASRFAESLLTKLEVPLPAVCERADVHAFRIPLPSLSIYVPSDTVLLICTSATRTPQSAVALCRADEIGRPRFALLVDLTPSQLAPRVIIQALKDSHPATVFVVVSEATLLSILLAQDASQAKRLLRRVIIEQCELRQIAPYRDGGSEIHAEDRSLFFGRQAELDQMLQQHRRNFVLVGPRQMGKSSLLNALSTEFVQRHPSVRVLKYQLPSGSLHAIASVDPTLRGDSPRAFYESVLQRTTEHQVFLLDEADKFIEQENKAQYPFCTVMRALSGQGRASFILAGHQELHEATQIADHPLRNFGQLLRLEPLDRDSAAQMILEPMEALGLRFSEQAETVDWLRDQTGCRPHLLAHVCWAVVSMRRPSGSPALCLAEIKAEVLSFQSLHAAFGAWIDARVQPLDRALIRSALLLGEPQTEDLRLFLRGRQINLTPEDIARSLNRLYAWHYVLIADARGRLYCPVPLFRYWLSEPAVDLRRGKAWTSPEHRLRAELENDLAALRGSAALAVS